MVEFSEFLRRVTATMRIRVYATLRDILGTKAIDLEVVEPTDVRHVLRQVVAAYPKFGPKLWDKNEKLKGTVQVLVNGRAINFLHGLETAVCPEDQVDLFPPVGGG
jgi:molybdopterin synthase sulfur carrier subunit